MDSREYWARREDKARRNYIRDEAKHLKVLQGIYEDMYARIEKEINAFYAKYARDEGITMAEARRRADTLDIEAYARKAKKYVKEKNFSQQANDEMKLYNLTMKVNRLELLKANIGLELIDGFDELQVEFGDALTERAIQEDKRQAGILGDSVFMSEKTAAVLVNASFHNATFSDRIWMHQALLRDEVDKQLRIGLIQGKNPKVLARAIRDRFRVSQRDAERLMITELARVQSSVQKASFERNGYDEYEFIAEPTACPICRALDGKHFKVADMLPAENCAPMHPRCRCSTAAYARLPWEVDKDQENERPYISEEGKGKPGHVNTDLVNTKAYHDKFMDLSKHKGVNESLYREAMEILRERNNSEYEDIVAINAKTGKLLVKNKLASSYGWKHQCGFSEEENMMLDQRGKKTGAQFDVLHNHPNSSLPSRDDIKKLFEREFQRASTIICHNGDVYRLEKLKPVGDIDKLIERIYTKTKEEKLGYSKGAIENTTSEMIIDALVRSKVLAYTKR